MRRGEVWWADLGGAAGRRPVLLLSRNAAYRVRSSATVAPITRTVRGIPVEVPIGPEDGMPSPCVVNLDDILTVPITRLIERLTELSPERMERVRHAVAYALDLGELD